MNIHELEFNSVSKFSDDYSGPRYLVFENISFKLHRGEFLTILAPEHTGKSLLMKMACGLTKCDSGSILFNSDKVSLGDLPYIPSAPSSFPWLNSAKNIEFVLKNISPQKNNKENLTRLIHLCGLDGYEEHYPDNRSTGYRFRLALARAIATGRNTFIIDDPFREVDTVTKIELYMILKKIHISEKLTVLLATSDLKEAIFLSDRILFLGGRPSHILKELENDLGTERSVDFLYSGEFKRLIRITEDLLLEEEGISGFKI